MDKEMLVIAKFKSDKFDKFMGWFQSDEGMGIRKSVAHVEQTVPGFAPDKSYSIFKITVHNFENLREFLTGNNPVAKDIYDECIDNIHLWELSKVDL